MTVVHKRARDADIGRLRTSIDLFCGAGGLTSGLERAGWSTVSVVDNDRDALATLEATRCAVLPVSGDAAGRCHLAGAKIVEADICLLTARDLRPDGEDASWRPDLLAGGPPCQPFSSAGKERGVTDPRGRLFVEFVRLAAELRPRLILFENVQGLVTARGPDGSPGGVLRLIQTAFEGIGYACRFELLNAADYGAAQRRVRLLMVASSGKEVPHFPPPTHAKSATTAQLHYVEPWVSLGELLDGLPYPDDDIVTPTGKYASDLLSLPPGSGLKTGGIVEANRPGGHWGYRQDAFVADPTQPSRTIRAASTPDWIWDRHGLLRRLTWRECAALQGFPPGWRFVGTKASLFRQIGNAVQGDVAVSVGRHLAQSVPDNDSRQAPESPPWPPYFFKRVNYTQMEHKVNGAHRQRARLERSA
ncbi:MAG: DNA cytosine methyltransferase [Actinomycetes bacterium]